MKQIVMMDPADLKPYENNPRDNDGAVEAVANSIREFGFKAPIIVDRDHVIIAGHTRLKAALSLRLKEVPVIVADDLTEEQVRAYRLADNKTGELAKWDDAKLREELEAISDVDMEGFGFEEPEDAEGCDEGPEIDEEDFGTDFVLPDVEDGPQVHTMTFVLSASQAEIVRSALGKAEDAVGSDKGEQLEEVCSRWLEQRTAS